MQWFELIRLRTTSDSASALLPTLTETARDFESKPDVAHCVIMHHALYEGDVAVALGYSDDGRAHRTAEALELADQLSNHGLVDHSVWSIVYPPEGCQPKLDESR